MLRLKLNSAKACVGRREDAALPATRLQGYRPSSRFGIFPNGDDDDDDDDEDDDEAPWLAGGTPGFVSLLLLGPGGPGFFRGLGSRLALALVWEPRATFGEIPTHAAMATHAGDSNDEGATLSELEDLEAWMDTTPQLADAECRAEGGSQLGFPPHVSTDSGACAARRSDCEGREGRELAAGTSRVTGNHPSAGSSSRINGDGDAAESSHQGEPVPCADSSTCQSGIPG